MGYRKKMGKNRSKGLFARTADKTHRKNVQKVGGVMRGGIRL